MKPFITGIITLTILILAVILNSIFITQKADALLKELNSLPIDLQSADTSDITEAWSKWSPFLSASVSRKKIDEIDDAIRQLELYVRSGNEFSYVSCREHLICLFERLRETESFSLSRIL